MANISDYHSLISDYIKNQIVMLGPSVALAKASKIKGIKVDNSGSVVEISGDAQGALETLHNEYKMLIGDIAQGSLDLLIKKYSQKVEVEDKV